jgi:hypothetical protein
MQAMVGLSLFCVAPVVRGQEIIDPGWQPNIAARRLFVLDHSVPAASTFKERERDPEFSALPDEPLPEIARDASGTSLDLAIPFDPQFQYGPPSNDVIKYVSPRSSNAAESVAQANTSQGYTPTSIAQANSDFGNLSVNGVDVGSTWIAVQRLMPPSVSLSAREAPIVDPSEPGYGDPGGYHWSGLLAQSLFFNIVENSFRAASDDQIRWMLANKPFWHDWFSSMKQFNMRRWNDGDDFLVNYVGHPMQGAVAGFIEIQNDPVGRELEIGSDPAYWKSRFMALLWATAYSTHSEISPLGEAGIGNEGGWTYPQNCKKPCAGWNPQTMKSTNNTGWVDFIITPAVGSLWLLGEDALDRFISDRVQGDNRSNLLPAFLRGALNPARSMANAMRLQSPWYRDRQHDPEIEDAMVVRVQPSEEQLEELGPLRRVAFAPFFATMPMGSPASPCFLCFGSPGVGTTVDVALNRWLSLSFAAQRRGGLLGKGYGTDGSTLSVEYGVRFVHEGLRSSFSLAVRPGRVIEEVPQPLQLRPETGIYYRPTEDYAHSAVTVMASEDFKVTRTMAVRYSLSDTIVRYRNPVDDPPGIGERPHLSWLSKDEFENKSNWSAEAGPVIRF